MSKEMITNTLLKLFSLENKVILATGAAGAIGSEIAKCYADLGAKVVIADFNEEAMAEVEKEIKKDNPARLHARRQMLKMLYPVTEVPSEPAGRRRNTKSVDIPAKLFDEIAPKYANRNGGYTRIIKIGQRKGDAAMEVLLELV